MTTHTDDERGRTAGPPCPLCESSLYKRHCKYVCPQHGVVYDCSDPFR
ncbi:HVO_2523 family zinc finger protein [Natronobeatus ordinarius]|nr:HVO_2523 family zinc finger protein [Natronobeatus ordinarius]